MSFLSEEHKKSFFLKFGLVAGILFLLQLALPYLFLTGLWHQDRSEKWYYLENAVKWKNKIWLVLSETTNVEDLSNPSRSKILFATPVKGKLTSVIKLDELPVVSFPPLVGQLFARFMLDPSQAKELLLDIQERESPERNDPKNSEAVPFRLFFPNSILS